MLEVVIQKAQTLSKMYSLRSRRFTVNPLSVIVFFGISVVAFSQVSFAETTETILESVPRDLISPVTTSARWALITGVPATTLALAFEDGADSWVRECSEDRPLGRFSKPADLAGRMIPNGAYALGMLASYAFGGSPESARKASVMIRATGYAAFVSTLLKFTTREPRPNDGHDHHSFPSGHATTSFAFASVIASEHDWYWGIPAIMLASAVGYGRMNDNRHWLHDVIGGATIGTAYGLGVSFRSKAALHRDSNEATSQQPKLSFGPLVGPDKLGVALRLNI